MGPVYTVAVHVIRMRERDVHNRMAHCGCAMHSRSLKPPENAHALWAPLAAVVAFVGHSLQLFFPALALWYQSAAPLSPPRTVHGQRMQP